MAQGWFAVLWVSLGFVIGLFVTARIALPILLGLPRAMRLVRSGEMRAAVYRRLLFTPVLWIVQLAVIVFLVGFFWPSAAAWFQSNDALISGLRLGVIGILLSALRRRLVQMFRQTLTSRMRSVTSVAPRVEDVVCLPTRAPSQSDLPLRGDIDLFIAEL
jgi:hypothetical protein